jgi:hypothetical protein
MCLVLKSVLRAIDRRTQSVQACRFLVEALGLVGSLLDVSAPFLIQLAVHGGRKRSGLRCALVRSRGEQRSKGQVTEGARRTKETVQVNASECSLSESESSLIRRIVMRKNKRWQAAKIEARFGRRVDTMPEIQL